MAIFSPETGFGDARVLHYGHQKQFSYNKEQRQRLNARYKVILEPLRDRIKGKTVLDLASHDGRWTYAALELGAQRVVGVEYRRDLIEFGAEIFDKFDPQRFSFIEGDVFDVLPKLKHEEARFDVILNFGLFYHVMDHYRLMKQMRDLDPKMILLDTGLIEADQPFVQLTMENTESILNVIENKYDETDNIVGLVSKGGLKMMCDSLGLYAEYINWDRDEYKSVPILQDYTIPRPGGRRRFSLILTPKPRGKQV